MIIGTAGHIDHGKSTLVTALTGRAMDRLAEERRRGITIELNFAPLELPGLPPLGIVDVPGHEAFVRTMVAGATGIDLVLLVVDAVEGIRPQTLEHLAIVEQLQIPLGIPVITKIDLAEADWIDLVAAELSERLDQSTVRFTEPLRVSAVTGAGLGDLREAIRAQAAALLNRKEDPRADDLLRLPIDRAFPVAGTGPVVTGTLWSGRLRSGDQVRVEPGGLAARVRSLESFGRSIDTAVPGARTAVGLSGISVGELSRGQVILGAQDWQATTRFDARLTLLESAPRPLVTRSRVRVHHGTAEVIARVYPRRPIQPGKAGPSRVVLEQPVVVRGGDRFVLRSYSPVATIGGGWVADPDPPAKSGWPDDLTAADPAGRLRALLERRSEGMGSDQVSRLLGPDRGAMDQLPGVTRVGTRLTLTDRLDLARKSLLAGLTAFHQRDPSSPGLSIETARSSLGRQAWMADDLLAGLASDGTVRMEGGVVALSSHRPVSKGGEAEVDLVVELVRGAGLEGPLASEIAGRHRFQDLPGALRLATARGLIEAVERDRFVARDSLERLEQTLREVGGGNVEISPAALKERLSLSRKHLIPLLEWADRKGITWRDREGVRRLKN